MIPDERDRIVLRLLAVWPTPQMADAQRIVWNEFLTGLEYWRASKALDSLQLQMPRRPAYSDFHEAYQAQRSQFPAVTSPECGICDDGWVTAPCGRPGCKKENCAVTRCPNGCLPMTREQRDAQLEVGRPNPDAGKRISAILKSRFQAREGA